MRHAILQRVRPRGDGCRLADFESQLRNCRRVERSSGFTLVEMLVALIVISVILTATAVALVSFSRTSVVNESRVRATATLTSLHENMQALPWNRVALYAEEIDVLSQVGVDTGASPAFDRGDGSDPEPLVLIPGPVNAGCPTSDPDCGRSPIVPQSLVEVEIDDRIYRIFQIVTETDQRVDSDQEPVKRFITIASWDVLGRTYTETFESLRAPTPGDRLVAEIPDVRLFLFSPRRVVLEGVEGDCDPDVETAPEDDVEPCRGRNRDEIRIFARTQVGVIGSSIDLALPADCTPSGEFAVSGGVMPLTLVPEFSATDQPQGWTGTIPVGACIFTVPDEADAPPAVLLTFDAVLDNPAGIDVEAVEYDFPIRIVTEASTPTSVQFIDSTDLVSNIQLYTGADGAVRFCDGVSLRGQVEHEDGAVSAMAYFAGTRSQSRVAAFDPDLDTFTIQWTEDEVAPWQFDAGVFEDQFYLVGVGGDPNQDSSFAESEPFEVSVGTCDEP